MLAPGTKRSISPRRDLTKRNQAKLKKASDQRLLDAEKEVAECTFEPVLNKRPSARRLKSDNYVDSYLYQPKMRKDRNKLDIEYEKQR